MRRVLAVILPTACSGSDEKLPTGPITATVTDYDLRLDLDTRLTHAKVTATITQEGDCWQLPFRGGAPTTVTLNGKPAEASVDANSITACGPGFTADKPLVLEIDHQIPLTTLGTTDVGYTLKTDSQLNTYEYLLSWVGECDRFAPCDNRPDQFAHYHYDVTHAAGTIARCPGVVSDVSATETTCDFDLDGGPTYSSFGVIASPAWTPTDLGTWAGVHVTLYDRASSGLLAAIDPAYHAGYLTWMQSMLGPWPYGGELRVLSAPTYWNGFEHPGNIVLSDALANERGAYKKPVEHVLDHEMAHMWAGDQTTLADTYDFAWKESMAEYFSFAYEDMMDQAAAPATTAYWKAAAAAAAYYPVPGDKPALVDYYGDAYGPGPMVLFRQLEVLTSRDQVLAAIKSVLGHQHALSVDELVTALAQSTGLDLSAYSAAWIHGSGKPAWPTVQVNFTPAMGTSTLSVRQVTSPDKRCKFHVGLEGDQPGQQTLVAVDTFRDGLTQSIPVATPAYAVTNVVLDPLGECLVYGAAFRAPARFNPWQAQR